MKTSAVQSIPKPKTPSLPSSRPPKIRKMPTTTSSTRTRRGTSLSQTSLANWVERTQATTILITSPNRMRRLSRMTIHSIDQNPPLKLKIVLATKFK